MSTVDRPFSPPLRRPATAALVLPAFTVSLFLSALLLFAIQPMFTKMVLPALGGSPAVWSVAMVFFQAVLLGGYLYAHLLTTRLGLRRAALVHLVVLAAAATTLPIAMAHGWGRPPVEGTAVWLLGLFAMSVGLPFFAVSANGPLLQAWFARSGSPHAADPYFLYGASNLGSFSALILYPVLFEPLLTLAQQSHAWAVGFGTLAALIMACAVLAQRAGDEAQVAPLAVSAAPTWRRRLGWACLAFVPSALLVAVTAHISTDVAAAPFLWVLPLSLFLLTFTLAFRDPPLLSRMGMLRLQPAFVAAMAFLFVSGFSLHPGIVLPIVLGGYFVTAMVAHGELYRLRPPADRLTEFYLWMSFGGVVGGAFTSLLAPHIFSAIVEYPLVLVLALFCRPAFRSASPRAWMPELLCLAALAVVLAAPGALGLVQPSPQSLGGRTLLLGALAMVAAVSGNRPARLAGITAMILILGAVYVPGQGKVENLRSFFGVNRVVETSDGQYRLLMHGTTVHGAMRIRNADGTPSAGSPVPETYYYAGGPISQAIGSVRQAQGGLGRVGVVGLGAGSLACDRMAGETWRFYEIDPEVAKIARDPARFRFLSDCAPDAAIVLGDARLTLSDERDKLSLIVLDAFSSDSIPLHLLTTEAFAGYMARLDEHGAIVMNITNRHLDLTGVVARTAAADGLVTYVKRDPLKADLTRNYDAPAVAAVLARRDADVGAIASDPSWRKLEPDPAIGAWTDDYSNLLGVMWRQSGL